MQQSRTKDSEDTEYKTLISFLQAQVKVGSISERVKDKLEWLYFEKATSHDQDSLINAIREIVCVMIQENNNILIENISLNIIWDQILQQLNEVNQELSKPFYPLSSTSLTQVRLLIKPDTKKRKIPLVRSSNERTELEHNAANIPSHSACTTSFQNNCGLNALVHKIVKNLNKIPSKGLELLYQVFLGYYELTAENISLKTMQSLLRSTENPVYLEVLLGPILRKMLLEELKAKGFKDGDVLYDETKGTGLLTPSEVLRLAIKFGITVECYEAPDYKVDKNKEVRDNLLADAKLTSEELKTDTLKLFHVNYGTGHWEYEEVDANELTKHNHYYNTNDRKLPEGFKYDAGRHLTRLKEFLSTSFRSSNTEPKINNLFHQFEQSSQLTDLTEDEEHELVLATLPKFVAAAKLPSAVVSTSLSAQPVPLAFSKSPVNLVSSSSQDAIPSLGSLPSSLSEADDVFLRERVNRVLGIKDGVINEKQKLLLARKASLKKIESIPKRSSFNLPKVEVTWDSPVPIIRKLYTDSKKSEQKQACLRYLLHYQHYNAEYTCDENQHLGYPIPLCAPQMLPGYIRTEYHRVVELVQPWLDIHLTDFYQKTFELKQDKIKDYINLGTFSTIRLLKVFFKQHYRLEELSSFVGDLNDKKNEKKDTQSKLNNVVIIPLSLTDLKKTGLEILSEQIAKLDPKLKPGTIRHNYQQIRFLFVLAISNIDCAVMWGAKWAEPKKTDKLQCFSLRSKELFGIKFVEKQEDDIFSLLNKFGAVPDRIALNQFITAVLGKEEKSNFDLDLKSIGISASSNQKDELDIAALSKKLNKKWRGFIDKIKKERIGKERDQSSTRFYQDAILRWQSCFFNSNPKIEEFVLPLLCSQVVPWDSENSGIIQWAKAYQNLCEIIMFCLEYFPDVAKEIDFKTTVLEMLYSQSMIPGENIYTSVGLYSYAMTAIFDIIDKVIHRDEFKANKLSVISISQNYFETLGVIENMAAQGHILTTRADSLSDIDPINKAPDILIADIHPNNAAKERLFQNVIAPWIKQALESVPERRMILILDITLNHLSDFVIQESLRVLHPFINQGRLEVFLIQSLAKLVQNGADNFSGGSCVYLGRVEEKNRHPQFSSGLPQKAAFFSFMIKHFQRISQCYFSLVRDNANWMHKELASCFLRTSKAVYITNDKAKNTFCALNVVPNVDPGTVYVAIGFDAFFQNLRIPEPHDLVLLTFNPEGFSGFDKYKRHAYLITDSDLFYLDAKNKQIKPIKITAEDLSLLKEKLSLPSIIPESQLLSSVSHEKLGIIASITGHRCLSRSGHALPDNEKESYVNALLKLLLESAKQCGLPLTGRQSFGFSISNMSHVACAIRFSIGVEESSFFHRYVEFIEDFSYGLSRYMANYHGIFDGERFKNHLMWIYETLKNGGERVSLATIPVREERMDLYYNEFEEEVGNADIFFRDCQLFVEINTIADDRMGTIRRVHVSEPFLGYRNSWHTYNEAEYWSYPILFRLFFHIRIAPEVLYFSENAIGGFLQPYHDFNDDSQLVDEKSNISIEFKPELNLKRPIGEQYEQYAANKVFVKVLPEFKLGTAPVTMERLALEPKAQSTVFNQCVHHHLGATKYPNEPGSILLEFLEERYSVNYLKRFVDLSKEDGLSRIVLYLNGLDLANLPITHDESWQDYENHAANSLQRLHNLLEKHVGAILSRCLTTDHIESIKTIDDIDCRRSVVKGIFKTLINDSTKNKHLDPKVAKIIAQMFSMPEFKGYKWIDIYDFDKWLDQIQEYMTKNAGNLDRLQPYFEAIFPIVRFFCKTSGSLCDVKHSLLFHRIGEQASFFPAWNEHIKKLKSNLCTHVAAREFTEPVNITSYLEFYVKYHYADENIKSQLLIEIGKKSAELRAQWVVDPIFYYVLFDHYELRLNHIDKDEAYILSKKEQSNIRNFFIGIGCQPILLDLLSKTNGDYDILKAGMRWAIITQDDGFFLALMIACQRTVLKKRVIDMLVTYTRHLDEKNLAQRGLKKFLMDKNNGFKNESIDEEDTGGLSFEENMSDEEITENIFKQFIEKRRGQAGLNSEAKAEDDNEIRKYISDLVKSGKTRVSSLHHVTSSGKKDEVKEGKSTDNNEPPKGIIPLNANSSTKSNKNEKRKSGCKSIGRHKLDLMSKTGGRWFTFTRLKAKGLSELGERKTEYRR